MRLPLEVERENWVNFRLGSSILALATGTANFADMHISIEDHSAWIQLAFRIPPFSVDECFKVLVLQNVPSVSPPKVLPH